MDTVQSDGESIRIGGGDSSYIHFEMLRIDLMLRKEILRWQNAGQDFGDKFRGLRIGLEQIHDLLQLPIGGSWADKGVLDSSAEDEFALAQAAVQEQLFNAIHDAGQAGQTIRLLQIRDWLGLSDFEYDALLICMAPAVDQRYEKIYGFLQDDVTQKYASAGLIFNLLLPPGVNRVQYLDCFSSGSLRRYRLIQPAEQQPAAAVSPLRQCYLPAPEILTWLIGGYRAPREFENILSIQPASEPKPLENNLSSEAELDLDRVVETRPIIILHGPDDLQQQKTARAISARLGRPLLIVDMAKTKPQQLADETLIGYVLRDSRLNRAIPCFRNWELLNSEPAFQQALFADLNEPDEVVILQSRNVWQVNRNGSRHIKPVVWINCELPNSARRVRLWQAMLDDEDCRPVKGEDITETGLELLAGQFTLTSEQIRNAVFTARDAALQADRTITTADLYAAARQHSSHHLESLAVKIPPRYGWNDIVLPKDEMDTLHEIAETVRWRAVVLEEWGLGRRLMPNAGISALFAGPSGTGKTLAAQVIAAELKMDLYKIDLSTVVSKYIGETEKNLERIFTQAHNSNSILFFDEADAIFGKRSEVKDAHDRYANIEVGYLLQRMETYDGVVILATNLRSNLDDAFTRRLQFIVDFPFPDEEERLKIWNVLFPCGVPREEGIDFETLAGRFKLTGGSIRNIIIGAAFLAASQGKPVSMQHILHSLRREMQNMGRLINEKDVLSLSQEGVHGK